MTTILVPCIVQLDYKENLLETIVNLLNFYSLNLWRILSGGLGWSSHTVMMYKSSGKLLFIQSCVPNGLLVL